MPTPLPNSSEALLHWFEGEWTVAREISGEGATFTGTAVFEPAEGSALSYRETGTLTLANGHSLHAHRRYRYRSSANRLEVLFDDGPDKGELFLTLTFAGTASGAFEASGVYDCGEDRYGVRYSLGTGDSFETEIAVAGPNKDYRAFSRYSRRPTALSKV